MTGRQRRDRARRRYLARKSAERWDALNDYMDERLAVTGDWASQIPDEPRRETSGVLPFKVCR